MHNQHTAEPLLRALQRRGLEKPNQTLRQVKSLFHAVAAAVHCGVGCLSATASKQLEGCRRKKRFIPSKLQSPVPQATHGTGMGSTLNWGSAAGYPSFTLSLSQASVTTWTLRHCRAALHNSRQPAARAPSACYQPCKHES